MYSRNLSAPAFAADFPPDAPKFNQRTLHVRLINLCTSEKKSSHKIRHSEIPRVHIKGMGENTKKEFGLGNAWAAALALGGVYVLMDIAAKKENRAECTDDAHPCIGGWQNGDEKKGNQPAYKTAVKPVIDKALSFGGLIILSPLHGLISLAVYLDDPGPVLFKQKRVGKDRHLFYLHKYRSMRMDTPHDVPTHLLDNPDRYITKVGRVLRRTSLDELPQIWDIFRGKMSVIGPRPALWNQKDLIEEREKYGANGVMPGLTGLAQINGRDELEIAEKAKWDGIYARQLARGGWKAFMRDVGCFFGTLYRVARQDGLVEGGTGKMKRKSFEPGKKNQRGEKRPLGRTGIDVTPLGFGCAGVWGKKMITDQQAQELFEKAYESGVRYFDTGHSYGNAEERIGKILRSSDIVRREELVIATKFGTRLRGRRLVHDVSPEWIRRSVHMSLQRMGIGYIDCLLIHGPQICDFTEGLYETLGELKEKGIVKAIGANSFDTEVLEYICGEKRLDFVMLDYNLMRQDREGLIERLYNNGIGVIAGAPLAESLYSNRVLKIKGAKDLWYLAERCSACKAAPNKERRTLCGRFTTNKAN